MTSENIAYLWMVIAVFVVFAGTLAYISWSSRLD